MSDTRLRQIERAALSGDPEAAKRLGLEKCRNSFHSPPHFGDDERPGSVRVGTSQGSQELVDWVCPVCWVHVEALDPWWFHDADFWSKRWEEREQAAERARHHAGVCSTCRLNDQAEARAFAAVEAAPFGAKPIPSPAHVHCVEEQPGGIMAWRFDGMAEAERRRAAGEAP